MPQHKVLQGNMLAFMTSTAGGSLLAKVIDTYVVHSEIQASNVYVSLLTGHLE